MLSWNPCLSFHLSMSHLMSTYNTLGTGNTGMTSWPCVLIICRDPLVLIISVACFPCPFLPTGKTRPAYVFSWPLVPYVSEYSDWTGQKEKEGHYWYKELRSFCSFVPIHKGVSTAFPYIQMITVYCTMSLSWNTLSPISAAPAIAT